jgi:hypothetical protein
VFIGPLPNNESTCCSIYLISCVFEAAYADVIDIIARIEKAVRKAFENLEKNCTRDGTMGQGRKNPSTWK